MKILFRPQSAILAQLLVALHAVPQKEDGRYLMVLPGPAQGPFGKWKLELHECEPGDNEALKDVDSRAEVVFPNPAPGDTDAVVMATFQRHSHYGSMPFHFNPNLELSHEQAQKLGQDIADWLLSNFQLSSQQ